MENINYKRNFAIIMAKIIAHGFLDSKNQEPGQVASLLRRKTNQSCSEKPPQGSLGPSDISPHS